MVLTYQVPTPFPLLVGQINSPGHPVQDGRNCPCFSAAVELTKHSPKPSFLRARDLRYRDRFAILVHVSLDLNLRSGVRGNGAEVLVPNGKDLPVADKHVLAAAFDAGGRAFFGVLAHVTHRGMACATHAVADLTG
jgi:hypothetical protein